MRKPIRREDFPGLGEIEAELRRLQSRIIYRRALRSTLHTLIVVAAVSVLVAMLWLSVLRISGASMEPSLNDGDIVVGIKTNEVETGQICCFYYNNKLLLKRIIARAGDWVEIDADGYVFVNGERLTEPYVRERGLGICDISFPYQVPDGKLFMMGDRRLSSVDSRSSVVGCIETDQIVGRILVKIWPLQDIGIVR